MLTPQQAFKVGFLARCAAGGMTAEQTLRAVKTAAAVMEKRAFLGTLLGKGVDVAKGAVGGAARYGIPLALLAPPVIGGMAGYGLAKATDIDDTDVDDVKNRELVDEYRRQVGDIRRRRQARDFKQEMKTTGRPLF